MKNFKLLIAALSLTGCVSSYKQTQQQCSVIDWKRLGFETGQAGQVSPTTANKQQFGECQEVDVKPNFPAYSAGLKEGLRSYCQPQMAESAGARGSDFDFGLCGNSTELQKSHAVGVTQYCRSSGYVAGLQGKSLEVSCPTELITTFNSEYQRGRTETLLNRVNSLDNQLLALRRQMTDIERINKDLERKNRDLQSKLEDTERKLRK
jgi:hypothetical protein